MTAAIPRPVLMLVCETQRYGSAALADAVAQAVDGGVNVVRGVWSTSDGDDPRAIGLLLRKATAGARLLMPGMPDLPHEIGADGVHLRERDLATVAATRAAIWDGVVSRAVHSRVGAIGAEAEGADFIILGTVFPSKSHPDAETIGIEGVRTVCEAVHIPVIGIGGITAENAGSVIAAGARGVAVISAIFDAPDVGAAARELREAVDAAWQARCR